MKSKMYKFARLIAFMKLFVSPLGIVIEQPPTSFADLEKWTAKIRDLGALAQGRIIQVCSKMSSNTRNRVYGFWNQTFRCL